jgi:hypothetical protein
MTQGHISPNSETISRRFRHLAGPADHAQPPAARAGAAPRRLVTRCRLRAGMLRLGMPPHPAAHRRRIDSARAEFDLHRLNDEVQTSRSERWQGGPHSGCGLGCGSGNGV